MEIKINKRNRISIGIIIGFLTVVGFQKFSEIIEFFFDIPYTPIGTNIVVFIMSFFWLISCILLLGIIYYTYIFKLKINDNNFIAPFSLYNFRYKFINMLQKIIPLTLVLGLLGTFLGFSKIFSGIDPNNINMNILLEGAKTAFNTTIIGMFCYIFLTIFNLIYNYIIKTLEKQIEQHLYKEEQENNPFINELSKNIDKLINKFEQTTKETLVASSSQMIQAANAMGETTKEFSEAVVGLKDASPMFVKASKGLETFSKTLPDVMNKLTSLNELSNDFRDLRERLDKLIGAEEDIYGRLSKISDEFSNDLSKISASFENQVNNISENMQNNTNAIFEKFDNNLSKTFASFENQMNNISENIQNNTNTIFDKFNNNLNDFITNIKELNLEQGINNMKNAIVEIGETFNNTGREYNSLLSEFNNELGKIKDIISDTEEQAEHLIETLNNMQLEEFSDAFMRLLDTDKWEKLNRTISNLNNLDNFDERVFKGFNRAASEFVEKFKFLETFADNVKELTKNVKYNEKLVFNLYFEELEKYYKNINTLNSNIEELNTLLKNSNLSKQEYDNINTYNDISESEIINNNEIEEGENV